MRDPRQDITTMDVLVLLDVVAQASGKARKSAAKARLTELRLKLQAIGQFDAAAINAYRASIPAPHGETNE